MHWLMKQIVQTQTLDFTGAQQIYTGARAPVKGSKDAPVHNIKWYKTNP